MLVPVEISSFAADPQKGVPLVILRETDGGARSVAIPIELAEANAIAMHSLQVEVDKPFTVDLVKIAIEQLGGELYRSIITDVSEEKLFDASIVIRASSSLKVINCRPADAVALAVKCGAPMYVKDVVFEKMDTAAGQSAEEQLRERVRSVETVEFGRYALE